MKFKTVKSADGTAIAYETAGKGPPLILVGGAFCDRTAPTSGTPLAALLEDRFNVFSYDRRGRGDSEDARRHSIGREVEDIAALIHEAGGSASVFGNSSGGLLALDAAVQGLPISKLIVYEPPVILDKARAESFGKLAKQLEEAISENRRTEAVEAYLSKVMQMPAGAVEKMRKAPMWPGLEEIAHTLSYDLWITSQGPSRIERVAVVRTTTLVMDGGASQAWMREGIRVLADAVPNARHRTLEGQTHAVDPEALSREIGDFLGA